METAFEASRHPVCPRCDRVALELAKGSMAPIAAPVWPPDAERLDREYQDPGDPLGLGRATRASGRRPDGALATAAGQA